MRRDGRGHRLHEVVEFVQASLDNRLTESFEAPNVEHDVVVNEKDGARVSGLRISNVVEDTLECVGMEIAATHFDDRAETAIIGTAAPCLYPVDGAAEQSVAFQNTRGAIGRPDFAIFEPADRTIRIVNPTGANLVGKAADPIEATPHFQSAQEFAKCELTLSPHDEVQCHFLVRFARKTRIVAADYDADGWLSEAQ